MAPGPGCDPFAGAGFSLDHDAVLWQSMLALWLGPHRMPLPPHATLGEAEAYRQGRQEVLHQLMLYLQHRHACRATGTPCLPDGLCPCEQARAQALRLEEARP